MSQLPLRQQFLQYNGQTSPSPLLLQFTKAAGSYLYDTEGKKYLDLIAGIGVSNVGHSHHKVVEAINKQASQYLHQMVYGEYVQSPQVLYAKALVEQLPVQLNNVFFTNSGAEAIEGAMKLAKRSTGRTEIIACNNSYHGSTQGALSLMGNEYYKQAYRPLLPDIKFIRYNMAENIADITERTACVVIETIQGEAGIVVPQNSYLQAIAKRCKETGTLLVLDENQCAFGRTGKLFGFEYFGIVPDVLVLGKALGGGMPLGAFIADKKIMDSLSDNPILGHISTFAGHPVSCVAGLAAFEVLLQEKILDNVTAKGQLFKELLSGVGTAEVHGLGLMLALPFASYEQLKPVIDKAINKGIITDWFLHNSHTMRICPPLNISDEDIRWACETIKEVAA